jgi:hypothetical protein
VEREPDALDGGGDERPRIPRVPGQPDARGMSRWQGRLEHRHVFLGRIVDIGAELYAMTAVCVRGQMLREDNPDRGASAAELADYLSVQARARAETLFHGLWHNADAANRRLAKNVLDGSYTRAEEGVLAIHDDAPWIADTAPGPSPTGSVRRHVP